MANKLISMNKIRQILRLYSQGNSKRGVSLQTSVSRNTVKKHIKQFIDSRLTMDDIHGMSDSKLEELFGKAEIVELPEKKKDLLALFPGVEKELKKRGATRHKIWEAYRVQNLDGYSYTQFCDEYLHWRKRVNPVMHIEHKAGDKMYIDFAGAKLFLTDSLTGVERPVEVFLSVLGASQLTYVEAIESQQKEDFILVCEKALHYYGGVPQAMVPDNLKSAVTKSNKYEPTLNEAFAAFAEHYGFSILPARAYRPKDKSLVEGAVKLAYQRIYSLLPKIKYYNLQELNESIRIAMENHNNKIMSRRDYSRRQQFEEVERIALQALPALRFELKNQRMLTVMKDAHICLQEDKHYYSVPYGYIGKKVKLIYGRTEVEIFYNYECVAKHKRTKSPYNYTTVTDHMASAHRAYSDWNPTRFVNWAEKIHADVKEYILMVLEKKQHPEQSYKSCMGILSFERKAGSDRLIKACQRALGYNIYNYKIIQTILEKNMDQAILEEVNEQLVMPDHENIRGEDYYQ